MKNTLFICLFAMFALSGCVDDEEEFATGGNISPELTPENKENAVLNTAVFDQLNLDYPGLEKVKQYHEAGEDYLAASALLEYYRTRTNVINPNLSLVDVTYSDADLSKANYALEYRFYVNGQLEDPAIGKPYSVGKQELSIGPIILKEQVQNIRNSYTVINGSYRKLKYIVEPMMRNISIPGLKYIAIGLSKTRSQKQDL